MKKLTASKAVKLGLSSAILGGALFFSTNFASAHGYVEQPVSRGYAGELAKNSIGWGPALEKYGNVITNPQSLESPKGFPEAGPADGKIASADGGLGQIGDFVLDQQSLNRWDKQEMTGGVNSFVWKYTAEHKTTKWHYYITKKGWNPNAPLTRSEFELIGTVNHDGSMPSNNPVHKINVPTDRNGYYVILAVWDVADTPNAFYNVIDVNLKNDGSGEEGETPNQPQNLKSDDVTNTSIKLSWTAPTNTDVKEYNIYRDTIKVGTVGGTTFTDKELQEKTTYGYQVEAVGFDGKVSEKSSVVSVETKETPAEDTEKPSVPSKVHSMKTTSNSVDLMWTESTHPIAVKEYTVYRDGKKVGTTKTNRFLDTGLNAETNYVYTVKAVSIGGNISDKSDSFKVTTAKEMNEHREWKVGSFSNPVSYTANELVSYQGKNYKVLNTHVNYGDLTWAPGIPNSLFEEVK